MRVQLEDQFYLYQQHKPEVFLNLMIFFTSSRLFILSFEPDIDITNTDIFEPILTYYNFVMIAIRPKF